MDLVILLVLTLLSTAAASSLVNWQGVEVPFSSHYKACTAVFHNRIIHLEYKHYRQVNILMSNQ